MVKRVLVEFRGWVFLRFCVFFVVCFGLIVVCVLLIVYYVGGDWVGRELCFLGF